MGGKILAWGKSQKQHDNLIASLPGITERTMEALATIFSTINLITEESEKLARRGAQDAGLAYPEPGATPPALVALNTMVETLKGPRHEMTPDEVAFYRDGIRSILQRSNLLLRESAKLAKALKDGNVCLQKIEPFYSMGKKGAGRKPRPSKRSGKPKRRR